MILEGEGLAIWGGKVWVGSGERIKVEVGELWGKSFDEVFEGRKGIEWG